jgi:predicted metal-dependent phosphoesterase TrpH
MKRSRRIALPLLAAGLGAACAPDAPTPTESAAQAALDLVPVEAPAFDAVEGLQLAVDDAVGRVLPTLGVSQAVSDADAAFDALAAALATSTAADVRTAAAAARTAVDALETAGADEIEVAGLRLVLDAAEAEFPAT